MKARMLPTFLCSAGLLLWANVLRVDALPTVNWSATSDTFLTLPGGTVALSQGNLIEIGIFSISDSEIRTLQTSGTLSQSNAATLVANFTSFAQGLVGDGTGVDGSFAEASAADGTGFFNQPIYLVAFDAPTADAAQHVGVFKGNGALWVFPPDDTSVQSIDCSDVSSGGVLIGAFGAQTLDGTAYSLDGNANALELARIVGDGTSSNVNPVAGVYSGLVQSNSPSPETTGFISIALTENGSFSAAMLFRGLRLAFTGQFDGAGNYSTSVAAKSGISLSVSLHEESDNGIDQITGTISDDSFTSDVLAKVAAPAPATQFQGYYTLVFAPDSSTTDFPQGYGAGGANVDIAGTVNFKGTLADGTKVKQTANVCEDGSWPVYVPFPANKGMLAGWAIFTNLVGISDVSGTLTWSKPAQPKAKLYRNGFSDIVTVEGSRYAPPAIGTPALLVSNTTCNVLFTAGDGDLTSFLSNSVTLDLANKMTPCVADKSKFKITPSTGLFSGSFVNPATQKSMKFSGVLLQEQNFGAGFFLGTDQSGFITLQPSP